MNGMNSSHSTIATVSPKRLSSAGLKAFFNIARDWHLKNDQEIILLGNPSRAAYFKWKKAPETALLSRDTLERISYLLGIYKSLQILLPDNASADAWISKPNNVPLFGGQSALDRMLSGNVADLFVVRQYLDAARGGWS